MNATESASITPTLAPIFDLLPLGTLTVWSGGIVVAAVIGFFALFNYFDKSRKERQDRDDKADDRLIELLQAQIAALEKKVAELGTTVKTSADDILRLTQENRLMRDIFQGRDAETKRFQQEGFLAIQDGKQKGDEILLLVKQTGDTTQKMNANVERLIGAIEKHLIAMEKQQVVTITTGSASGGK